MVLSVRFVVLFLLIIGGCQTVYSQANLLSFNIFGGKGESVKKVTVRFAKTSCGGDSLAVFDRRKGSYVFNCFPDTRTEVYFEAPGYNLQVLTIAKSNLGKTIPVKLQKKGPQTIKIDDSDFKYWKLHNVLFLKEKEGKTFKFQQLIDSLQLFESPYYGENFYEHEEKIDFDGWNDPVLRAFRTSGMTLVAAPVILLFKERAEGDNKFRSVNKLLPVTNIFEFENNKKPDPAIIKALGLEEIFIYENKWKANSPKAYQSLNPGLGLQVLCLQNTMDLLHPDFQIKCLDVDNHFSLGLNESEEE